VYPETKHPSYFASLGLPLEYPLLAALRRHDLDRPGAPVFVQSFETHNLERLREHTQLPLIQLVDLGGAPYDLERTGDPRTYRDLVSPAGLGRIAAYASGVGVHKDLVLPRDTAGKVGPPGTVVDHAHEHGLLVHAWTLRNENQFMADDFRVGSDPNASGDAQTEIEAFLDAGVDGFFTDHADTGVIARDGWLSLLQAG
jgi:glycerophosphoryl diester phosphodiesterase